MKTKSPEFEFYLKTDLSKYAGKYVAIVKNKVAAFGVNAKEVFEKAQKKYPGSTPTLAKIPKGEVFVLVFR